MQPWRTVEPDGAHLTLAFLPHLGRSSQAVWVHAVREVAATTRSFAWRLSLVGGFPRPDRARVAFLAPRDQEGGP